MLQKFFCEHSLRPYEDSLRLIPPPPPVKTGIKRPGQTHRKPSQEGPKSNSDTYLNVRTPKSRQESAIKIRQPLGPDWVYKTQGHLTGSQQSDVPYKASRNTTRAVELRVPNTQAM